MQVEESDILLEVSKITIEIVVIGCILAGNVSKVDIVVDGSYKTAIRSPSLSNHWSIFYQISRL